MEAKIDLTVPATAYADDATSHIAPASIDTEVATEHMDAATSHIAPSTPLIIHTVTETSHTEASTAYIQDTTV